MHRLKPKDIRPAREAAVQEQNRLCPLCEQELRVEDAVLDHCHRTGQIRHALHRHCNMYIGAMENNLVRNRITPEQLKNILKNFQAYITNLKPVLHPTHRTPEEKIERARQRARRRRQAKR